MQELEDFELLQSFDGALSDGIKCVAHFHEFLRRRDGAGADSDKARTVAVTRRTKA